MPSSSVPRIREFESNLGVTYLQQSNFDEAEKVLRAALKLAPEAANLHYDLALALKLKDNLAGASSELREAIRLDPNLADAYYTYGVTLWQQGEFAAAAEQLRAAVRVRPDYAEAYYTLGAVYKQMDKLSEAAQSLARCYSLAAGFRGRPHYAGGRVTATGRCRRRRGGKSSRPRTEQTEDQLAGSGFCHQLRAAAAFSG